ncbi:diguanylate cyclase domain-containing protein [Pseudomonas matsuisoli]|uniref:diguanylate cyclase domain-containing protein n=1 Tax=Pseudomonas matsuisoli TaxID=1515666 RepID=UPI00166316D9|nr:diguanylate cyclase [Pseudomonas matsuisoli]
MRHILVVEDSPLVLKILGHLFRQQPGLEPVFCASYAEAQLMLETSAASFSASIVDLHLPDAPRGEIVDLILSYSLPCVVLSGSYDETRRNELLAKGIVDYVLKESQYSYDYAFRLLHRLESNRNVKILVADDSEATRNLIRRVLAPQRFQIIEARDGNEALAVLQAQTDIDLFLVDHSMPGTSGFELVKILRQKMRRSELIILGLSADDKGTLSAQFIKHGADDFLRKPFCPEELNCRVISSLERRDLMRALRRAAQYDSLTNLLNRRAFYEQATQRLHDAKREEKQVCMTMIDMDYFKSINDQFGHASGDSALSTFSKAFRRFFPDDVLGRLGGEEFALLSVRPGSEVVATLDALRQRCAKLDYAAGAPPLSFSAGAYESKASDLENLLHQADRNLYRAKHQGRGVTVLGTSHSDSNG